MNGDKEFMNGGERHKRRPMPEGLAQALYKGHSFITSLVFRVSLVPQSLCLSVHRPWSMVQSYQFNMDFMDPVVGHL